MNTIQSRLKTWADSSPTKIAYRFLDRHLNVIDEISYHSISVEVEKTATQFKRLTPEGSPVLLVSDLNREFIIHFFGALHAGRIPIVSHSAKFFYWKRNRPRLEALLTATGATTWILDKASAELFQDFSDKEANRFTFQTFAIEEGPAKPLSFSQVDTFFRLREFHSSHPVAFLQFTSGSTQAPKGAIITHENLIHNLGEICLRTEQTASSEMFTWLPHSHDMGLIGGLLVPIYAGGTCTVLSQLDFLRNPLNWLIGMTKWKSTITAAPAFAYRTCLQALSSQALDLPIDLQCLKTAFIGAEKIPIGLIKDLEQAASQINLAFESVYPAYGLAESTLMVSGPEKRSRPKILKTPDHKIQAVSCGTALNGIEVRLSQRGEVIVSGKSVSPGYWRAPDLLLHKESFATGDLGILIDGELCLLGRLGSSFSINGQKVYPEDLEHTLAALHEFANIKFAVTHIEDDLSVHAVVAIESATESAANECLKSLAKRTIGAEHMLQIKVLFCEKGQLAFTTSGKPRRDEIKALVSSMAPYKQG